MTDIKELGLDSRVEGALARADIFDVGALEAMLVDGDEAVLGVDGIGRKSLEEIKAALTSFHAGPLESELGAEEPHHSKPVMVRVLCDMGILAGQAVWKGERHQVTYGQYQAAKRDNPDGYALEFNE